MKNLLAGAALAAFALAGPAYAADMPVKAPPPVKKVFNWTGCYVGVHAGYGYGNSEVDYGLNTLGVTPGRAASADIHPRGPEFGGTLGCDYVVGNGFVIGVLGDAAWIPMDRDRLEVLFPPFRLEAKEQWLATARGRIGVDMGAWGLWYVTGGGAFTDLRLTNFSPANLALSTSETKSLSGWVAGWGTEYPLSQNLTLKTETLYMDLGTHTFLSATNPVSGAEYRVRQTQWVSKVGLNYRFDWAGGPVTARY
jgi:outer membrane immunogenic protein